MKRIGLGIGALLMAGALFAQKPAPHRPSRPQVNLSLWKSVATQRMDTVGTTWLNLGILSTMNRLHGVGVNVLGCMTHREMYGVSVAGVAHLTGDSMKGIQLSGLANVSGESLRGLSLSGLVNIAGKDARGFTGSGLATICGDHAQGITLGGLLNLNAGKMKGVQLGGLANLSGETMEGLSLAGLLNVTGDCMKGVQLAALANVTANRLRGVQLAALGNVTGGTLQGLQIGPANMASRVKGVQIGLFNYYKDTLSGFQIGLVNANPRTRYQLMVYGGNAAKMNVGVRFKNRRTYTVVGMGTGYREVGSKFSASFSYRAGMELPVYKAFSLSGDLGYQHIESFHNKHRGHPARLYALQARLNAHYRLTKTLGVFVTGGYGGSRYYDRNATYDKGMIAEAGILLF